MSSQGGLNAGATTYQTIVIAIVAGGILTTGVLSVIWKRRNRRQWIELRRSLGPPGNGLPGGQRAEAKSIGKEPKLWDVVIGRRPMGRVEEEMIEEIDTDLGDLGEKTISPRKEDEGDDKENGKIEPDMSGETMSGWKPTSVSLLHHPPAGGVSPEPTPFGVQPTSQSSAPSRQYGSYATELTLLIAMPSPPPPPPSSFSSTSTPSPARDNHRPDDSTDYPVLYRHVPRPADPDSLYDDDEEPLPPLVIGSTCVPVSSASRAQRRTLEKYLQEGEKSWGRAEGRAIYEADDVDLGWLNPPNTGLGGMANSQYAMRMATRGSFIPAGSFPYTTRTMI